MTAQPRVCWADRAKAEGRRAARELRTEAANPYPVRSVRWMAWRRAFLQERKSMS